MKSVLVLLLITHTVQAQTWDEFFAQHKTQKKYLLEQIAALQMYAGYAAKGFAIIQEGLQTVGQIKKGELHLHNDFFAALSKVSPAVKKYARFSEIIIMQLDITKQSSATVKACIGQPEMEYLKNVFNHVLDRCAANLDELNQLLKGEGKSTDDEKIRRMDAIYLDMQDKQSFVQAFSNSAKDLAMQRALEEKEIQNAKQLNGIK